MSKIPEEFIKKTNSGKFPKEAKKYFVNMTSDSKKLHKTNCEKCYYSTSSYSYIDFDNVSEAFTFFKRYGKDISRCEHCFEESEIIK